MTTTQTGFRGRLYQPLPQTCCACGKAPATGVISYAGKVHEPHCNACCKAWEYLLRGLLLATKHYALTLADFREWQALRARVA